MQLKFLAQTYYSRVTVVDIYLDSENYYETAEESGW